LERKGVGVLFLHAHLPPYRRRLGIRVGGRQQQLRLMRTQRARRFRTGGPPLETALRQSFRGEPEPLAVIGQQFYRCSPAAAEDEQTAGKWICSQFFPA
jgi:hypothetical protein